MKKILKLILNLILTKWHFKKPEKKFFLIYDREGVEILSFYLKKKSFEVLDVRYESINFYILLFTVFNNGIVNLITNYKINYIKAVSPKFVITLIDNNLSFYKLKNIYKETIFISIQNGRRDNIFFSQCHEYYLQRTERLSIDFFFALGKNEIQRYNKYIDGKFYSLGSLKNNYFFLKKKLNKDSKKKVLFISKKMNFLKGDQEILKFNTVYKYCQSKGYQLSLCTRSSFFEEKYYRNRLIEGNWIYIPYSMQSSYRSINSSNLVVFSNSTLGFEALIKKKRGVVFPLDSKSFPIKDYVKKFPKTGPFWISNFEERKGIKLLKKVENYSQYEWNSIIKKYIFDIISYDPGNKIFLKKLKTYKIYDK
jgi:hypothetical protein